MSENISLEYLNRLVFRDNDFTYDDKAYAYKDIQHIDFTATATRHSVNGIPTGTTYEANLILELASGKSLRIKQEKALFGRGQKSFFEALMRANEIFSEITFNQRIETYEDSLKEKGFVTWGRYQIDKKADLFKDHEFLFNIKDKNVTVSKSSPFEIKASIKKDGFWAKLFGSEESILIHRDRDCFLYFMKNHLGLSWKDESIRTKRPRTKEAFQDALILLAAELCKADGRISPSEVAAFSKYFAITESGSAKKFNEALKSKGSMEKAAEQIYDLFGDSKEPLEYVLIGLLQIAAADGHIDAHERRFIQKVAKVFNFSAADVSRIFATFEGMGDEDEYVSSTSHSRYFKVLGVKEGAPWDEIKSAYRDLARKHHPDLLRAQGIPLEEIRDAEEVLKVINVAYERLESHYGIRKAA